MRIIYTPFVYFLNKKRTTKFLSLLARLTRLYFIRLLFEFDLVTHQFDYHIPLIHLV